MNPYGPLIETLNDWNAVLGLCGCCEFDSRAALYLKWETVAVTGSERGFRDANRKPFKKKKTLIHNPMTDESSTSTTYDPGYTYNFNLEGPSYESYRMTVGPPDTRSFTDFYDPPVAISKCGVSNGSALQQTKEGTFYFTEVSTGGYVNPADIASKFTHLDSTITTEYLVIDNEWRRRTTESSYNAYQGGDTGKIWMFDGPNNTTTVSSPLYNQSIAFSNKTYEYLEPQEKDAVRQAVIEAAKGLNFSDCPSYQIFKDYDNISIRAANVFWTEVTEATETIPDFGDFTISAQANRVRYRWKIGEGWLSTKCKITWGILNTPKDGAPYLDENEMTWEWTGPGDKNDTEGETWLSPFYDLSAPEFLGRRELVNIRYEYMPNNPYGSKPEICGLGFEPPAP